MILGPSAWHTGGRRARLLAALEAWDRRSSAWALSSRTRLVTYEFVRFGIKQGWACLFGGTMLALLLLTHWFYPAHAVLARYDALTLAALGLQVMLLAAGMESWEEFRAIIVFHVVGTGMELFKTAAGSWVYPEPSLLRIGGVPLFTGFMYAAVGSYLVRAWRLFDFRFTHHPPVWAVLGLAAVIYVNFFTHHFVYDIRAVLFVLAGLLFGRAWVHYRIWREHRRMPLLLGLVLVSVFIWFAENIGTFAQGWVYPHQVRGWVPVGVPKLGAWFLLMLISYALVAANNGVRAYHPLYRPGGARE